MTTHRPFAVGVALSAALLTLVAGTAGAAAAHGPGTGPMNDAFTRAADVYGMPRDLLVAVGYGQTRLDGHQGRPSQAGGYGVMHLVENPVQQTLALAAELTGTDRDELRHDQGDNIMGAAAVLRSYADGLGLDAAERADPGAWYQVVARYGGGDDATAAGYADAVYALLTEGVEARTPTGETVLVHGQPVIPERGRYADLLDSLADADDPGPDYPSARWEPAHEENFEPGRTSPITTVVVHVAQGYYDGTISWFQNPAARVSSHYVVRSSDGEVTQMVRDADTAWHAKSANASSIGIEHEGFIDEPAWFTETMYRSSAALTRFLCDSYDIPRDREHIVGHVEVPGNDHTDPGPNWDWDHYLDLVNAD
ncbi:N-acetylmuramoyl-L-alanine amidase [Streptomyces sp. NPDC127098]|uniref:N-acetylmuramoyl-L-alanine amidase n=1 Tax=Streptomyces sp. NPDC127098 TaxID=3347137 RepID=UPI0036578663